MVEHVRRLAIISRRQEEGRRLNSMEDVKAAEQQESVAVVVMYLQLEHGVPSWFAIIGGGAVIGAAIGAVVALLVI